MADIPLSEIDQHPVFSKGVYQTLDLMSLVRILIMVGSILIAIFMWFLLSPVITGNFENKSIDSIIFIVCGFALMAGGGAFGYALMSLLPQPFRIMFLEREGGESLIFHLNKNTQIKLPIQNNSSDCKILNEDRIQIIPVNSTEAIEIPRIFCGIKQVDFKNYNDTSKYGPYRLSIVDHRFKMTKIEQELDLAPQEFPVW